MSFINSCLNYLIIHFIFTVPLIYIDASNDDGIGGADIIYQKEIIKKIPEKSGCLKNATIQSFVKCRKTSLKQFLEYAEGFAEGGVIFESIFELVRYFCIESMVDYTENTFWDYHTFKVKCKVPALDFTNFDTSYLSYCSTKDSALEMDALIYKLAQKVQGKEYILGQQALF